MGSIVWFGAAASAARAMAPRLAAGAAALLLACCPAPGAEAAASGVTTPVVVDGRLMRDGKPYRAIGMDVRDLADEILDKGEAAVDSLACIRYLGEKKIPFIRFWASYFDDVPAKYKRNPDYWRHMDILIDACEKANVGIVPTLFWEGTDLPWRFGEFRTSWSDPDSRTRAWQREYVAKFVTRYRNRKIVWGYEFANEDSLGWDLPNYRELVPPEHRDRRNDYRYSDGIQAARAFACEVRRYDAHRLISSGSSNPREAQFHMATEDRASGHPWAKDTDEQQYEASVWTAPDPVNLLSIHYYPPYTGYDGAVVRRDLSSYMGYAQRMGKPLFVGELGVADQDDQFAKRVDDATYRKHVEDTLEAIYEAKVPLTAWWVYAVKPWGFGVGAVNPSFGRFNFVADLIAGYNARIEQDLAR
jgi:hypothetical protein